MNESKWGSNEPIKLPLNLPLSFHGEIRKTITQIQGYCWLPNNKRGHFFKSYWKKRLGIISPCTLTLLKGPIFSKRKGHFENWRTILPMAISKFIPADTIALDKVLFQSKSIDIFLISPCKHMLWILIKSTLIGEVLLMSTHNIFHGEIRNIFTWYPHLFRPKDTCTHLICSYVRSCSVSFFNPCHAE